MDIFMELFNLFFKSSKDNKEPVKQEKIPVPAENQKPVKPDGIYYVPDQPQQHKMEVQHIELTYQQAKEKGWHFKRKSRRRLRITRYTGTDRNIIIPAKIDGYIVNEIGSTAFRKTDIDSVEIPDTIKKMQEKCFFRSKVKKVTFAEGIMHLPDEAFMCCEHLNYVHLPVLLCRIGRRAFYCCKSLNYINGPYYCTIRDEAFMYSGLEGCALWHYSYAFGVDGSTFVGTPLQKKHELILYPKKYKDDTDYDVLLIGSCAKVKLPSGSKVYLGRNSIMHGCTLDLSECSSVKISMEAFSYLTNQWVNGLAYILTCKVILPQGENSVYLPKFVKAYYPDGTKYPGYISVKNQNEDKTVLHVHGNELPSFSITHNGKNLAVEVESEYSLKFHEYAVYSHNMESISFSRIHGEGELFSKWCYHLHKIEWNGYCVYIPPTELLQFQVHDQLLQAFSGRLTGGVYQFFDSSIIDQVFTEPITSYAKWYAPHQKPVRLSQMSKILIAVDVLRSTESLFENREIYVRYLQTHKRYANIVCSRLPEEWREYNDFLQSFYQD